MRTAVAFRFVSHSLLIRVVGQHRRATEGSKMLTPQDHAERDLDCKGLQQLKRIKAHQEFFLPDVGVPRKRRHRPHHRPPDGLLTMEEAAARLGCSTRTLRGHIADGDIGYVMLGHGAKRTRKMSAPADLDAFIANNRRKEAAECLSAATRARPSGSLTSSSEVIAFSARRSARPNAKRKM